MIDHRTEPITFEHARLVLSALGKFHALSFALKDKGHAEFKEFAQNIPDVLFDENNDRVKGYFETFKPLIYGTLREDENELRQKLAGIFEPSVFDAIKRCVDGPGAEPYAVICHGDCWTNNILYKFDEAISLAITRISVSHTLCFVETRASRSQSSRLASLASCFAGR